MNIISNYILLQFLSLQMLTISVLIIN